jgi:outer membrane protein TolC
MFMFCDMMNFNMNNHFAQMWKTLLIACGIWGFVANTLAQSADKELLSLDKAIEKALTQNPQLKAENAKIDAAKASLSETNAFFLPQVSVSETAIFTNSPLNVFGFKLQQERVKMEDFNPDVLNNPKDIQNFLTQLEVLIPLVNLDGWQYKQAALQGVYAANYQKQFAETYTSFYVKQTYFAIQLFEKSEKVILKAITTTEAVLKLVQDNIAAGYAKKSDELAVKVRLSELQAQLSQLNNQKKSVIDQLNQLMGTPIGTNWSFSDSLPLNLSLINQQTNQQIDLQNRADFQAWQSGLSARNFAFQAAKSKLLPSLNAFGNYSLYDKSLFGFGADNYMVGVQLKWTIFAGTRNKALIQKAAAEKQTSQLEFEAYQSKSLAEFQQAQRALETQQKELNAASEAIAYSQEAFKILKDRFEQGMERTSELLMAETKLAEQQLRYERAKFQLYVAQIHLDLLSSTASKIEINHSIFR